MYTSAENVFLSSKYLSLISLCLLFNSGVFFYRDGYTLSCFGNSSVILCARLYPIRVNCWIPISSTTICFTFIICFILLLFIFSNLDLPADRLQKVTSSFFLYRSFICHWLISKLICPICFSLLLLYLHFHHSPMVNDCGANTSSIIHNNAILIPPKRGNWKLHRDQSIYYKTTRFPIKDNFFKFSTDIPRIWFFISWKSIVQIYIF